MAALVALTMVPGCIDHCGPTLTSVSVRSNVEMTLTPENRTSAREALEAQGFVVVSPDGPYGFFEMVNGDETAFVGSNGTHSFLQLDVDLPDQAFDHYASFDEVRNAAEEYRPAALGRFDEIRAGFLAHTGWTGAADRDFSPGFYIC